MDKDSTSASASPPRSASAARQASLWAPGTSRGAATNSSEGDPDFQPGDEISFSFGLDALGERADGGPSNPLALRLDATYRIFGTDQLDGDDLYEEGNQLEAQVLGTLQGRRWGGFALGRLVLKDDDTVLASAGEVGKVTQAPGTGFLARAGVDTRAGSSARIGAEFETQIFSGSDAPQTNGATFGFGPSLTWGWSNGAHLQLRALYLGGTIDGDDTRPEIDLRGWDIGMGFHWNPVD